MNIAIIGGSGFVGTKLIDVLSASGIFDLKNIDKNNSTVYPNITVIGDVLDQDKLSFELNGVDVVVLLAAEHRDDVSPISLYYDVNVQGLKNTLQAMKEKNVQRLVFTSSVAIYGLDKDNPDENFPADPFNHYGKSKWQAEQVLQDWHKLNPDLNVNIVRPTVIFGEGNRGNVFNLLSQIASGKFLMIGSGENQKSMSYIQNIVAFIEFLILEKKDGYNIYNYVDKPDFNTKDLVYHTGKILGKNIPSVKIPYWLGMLAGYGFDVLAFVTGKKLNVSSVRVKKFCAVTKYDSTKAMSSGFVPPFTMEEGLRRMLNAEFGK
ncbi:NAD-dependent epimerase/dehydratase family protein [Sphingobacterium rhinopitheci]|uniref:NAD-dependent epimerase/dehydratase family protein n=1 Tax=Sphingobacterium rhinopitheci TaxID=2781960 RepID=UPI001F5186F4|nr:NAD-dependent epimerase/dehydratase family protein [Sphingobacterium rhinopitheci]MCI0920771.1 NAD-dependent epimerase/dehydratase family protein [Sphingobacterium rhinopitheci]